MLQWSQIALNNLTEIEQYYTPINPDLALQIENAIIERAFLADKVPFASTQVAGMSKNYRIALAYKNRYKIYYKVKRGNIIKILYIRHTSRQTPTPQELLKAERK